jgi:predicted nucleic acid-binding protein
VFDAGPLSLYYEGDLSVKPYFQRIFSSGATGCISEVNLAEFYYKAALKKRLETVDVWYRQIRQSPFRIVPPNDAITRRAAIWKVKRNDLSLADCFALATTQEVARVLLTTDPVLAKIKEVRSVHFPL